MAQTAIQKAKAQAAKTKAADLKAQDALREAVVDDNTNKSVDASKASADKMQAETDKETKLNKTLEGDAGDSVRKTVIVERKYTESKAKIFAQTVIKKNGVNKLVPFKIPVETEVSLPVEIIAMLKDRKTPKQTADKQTLVPEFVVTIVGD